MRSERELKEQRDRETAYYARDRWDNVARERIDVGRLAARLQSAALGEYSSTDEGVRKLVEFIAQQIGAAHAYYGLQLDLKWKKAFYQEVGRLIGELRMTTAEVKAAEILIDRIWPRLAQVEHKGAVDQNHRVLVLPAPIKNSADWSKNAIASDASSVLRRVVPEDVAEVAMLPVPPPAGREPEAI